MAVGLADPDTTAAWAAEHDYLYEIWSDLDRVLMEHYGAVSDFDDAPLRHAYILDAEGRAVVWHEGAVSLGADPALVLDDCRALFGGG